MSILVLLEQTLNGLQFGLILFFMAAGLTLIFGAMGIIKLARGSLYIVGAFAAADIARLKAETSLGPLVVDTYILELSTIADRAVITERYLGV